MMKFARRAVLGAVVAIAVAGTATASVQDRRVRVHNDTGVTLTHLYSTSSGQADWGGDILGSDVIGAGQSIIVDFDDGSGACIFEIRARFADGDVLEEYRINVCQVSDLTFG